MKVQCPACQAISFSPSSSQGQQRPCIHCGHIFLRTADATIIEQPQPAPTATCRPKPAPTKPIENKPKPAAFNRTPQQATPKANNATETIQYAGPWRRSAAHLIDGIILIPASFLLPALKKGLMLETLLATWSLTNFLLASLIGIALNLILMAIYVYYFAKMQSSTKQATLGEMAMGIIITDTNNYRISFARAALRFMATTISLLPLCFGFIMIPFTKRKQALHDKITSTLIIKSNVNNSYRYKRTVIKIVLIYLSITAFSVASSKVTYHLKYSKLDDLKVPTAQLTEKVTSLFVIPEELGQFEVTELTDSERAMNISSKIISAHIWRINKGHMKKWVDMSDGEKIEYLKFKDSVIETLKIGVGQLGGVFEVKEDKYTNGDYGLWQSQEDKESWEVRYSYIPEGYNSHSPKIQITILLTQIE